mmetsp:Transcript_13066/g.32267  ORF Transcript_13066/g.32267 Transcript_13066/m.32267 type:complete len:793 (+) Transcript_13066:67-2445(+)
MAAKVGPYLMFETIGSGAFGRVKVGVHEETGEQVAVKILEKSAIQKNSLTLQVRREVAIMKALRHRNIVNLHQVLTSATKIYMVMDLVRGGELFDKIAARGEGGVPEDEARGYFQQLVDGVHYCHRRGVYHRDLKPENLLVSEEGELKVTDFGLSTIRGGENTGDILQTQCGTPSYVAPEVIGKGVQGYSGQKVDTWACGIILFALLSGYLPFDGEDINELFYHIQRSEIDYPSWISPDAKDLIRRMLFKRPEKRYNLKEVKEHPWFRVGYNPDLSPDPLERRRTSASTDTVEVRRDSVDSLNTIRAEIGMPIPAGDTAPPDPERSSASSRSSSQSDLHEKESTVRTSAGSTNRKGSAIFAPLPKGFSTLHSQDGSDESIGQPNRASSTASPSQIPPNGLPRTRSDRSNKSNRSSSLQEEDMSEEASDDEDEAQLPREDMNLVKSIRKVQTLVVMSGRKLDAEPAPRSKSKNLANESIHFAQLAGMLQPSKSSAADGTSQAKDQERAHLIQDLQTIDRRIDRIEANDLGVRPDEVAQVKRLLGAWLARLTRGSHGSNGVTIGERDMSTFRKVLAKLDSRTMGNNRAKDLESSDEPVPPEPPRAPRPPLRRDKITEDELHTSLYEVMTNRSVRDRVVGVPLYMSRGRGSQGAVATQHSPSGQETKREKVAAGLVGFEQAVGGYSAAPGQVFNGTHFESSYSVEVCMNELGKLMIRMGFQVVRKRGENKLKCFVSSKRVPVAVEVRAADRNHSMVIFRKGKPERGKPGIDSSGLYQFFNTVVAEFRKTANGAVL